MEEKKKRPRIKTGTNSPLKERNESIDPPESSDVLAFNPKPRQDRDDRDNEERKPWQDRNNQGGGFERKPWQDRDNQGGGER
ncbi:MAG: hypothetical protein LW693_12370, partial [Saprospiraceae bacterium]|nr:hypothetical protein [Saprospiraceae bacterium]